MAIFPSFQDKQHCIHVSSRTDSDDDDVVDVTSLSALDVVEIKSKHCIHVVVTFILHFFFGNLDNPGIGGGDCRTAFKDGRRLRPTALIFSRKVS